MASSAVQGFSDPYAYSYPVVDSSKNFANQDSGAFGSTWGSTGIPGLVMKLMGFDSDRLKDQIETARSQEYERASIQSARAWSEYMDNTQYQRRVEDLKKAGLNPWLAVQNGISGSGSPTVDTGGSAKNQTKSEQSMSGLGSLLMAIAKIIG